jgi:Ca2+/H+ antiporter
MGVAFSSDDSYLAIAHATTPFITIYDFLTDQGYLYDTTAGDLVNLMPTLFIIGIVVGVGGYLIFKKKQE